MAEVCIIQMGLSALTLHHYRNGQWLHENPTSLTELKPATYHLLFEVEATEEMLKKIPPLLRVDKIASIRDVLALRSDAHLSVIYCLLKAQSITLYGIHHKKGIIERQIHPTKLAPELERTQRYFSRFGANPSSVHAKDILIQEILLSFLAMPHTFHHSYQKLKVQQCIAMWYRWLPSLLLTGIILFSTAAGWHIYRIIQLSSAYQRVSTFLKSSKETSDKLHHSILFKDYLTLKQPWPNLPFLLSQIKQVVQGEWIATKIDWTKKTLTLSFQVDPKKCTSIDAKKNQLQKLLNLPIHWEEHHDIPLSLVCQISFP